MHAPGPVRCGLLVPLLSIMVSFVSGEVLAEGWEIKPKISVGAAHSDNIALEPDGEEDSEIVAAVVPEIAIIGDTRRLEADLRYRFQGYYYVDEEDDQAYHDVDAYSTLMLLDDELFVYGSFTRSQVIKTPDSAFAQSNIATTDNFTDVSNAELRPYWRRQFGRYTKLDVEYARVWTWYGDSDAQDSVGRDFNLQDSETDEVLFSLDNLARRSGFSWRARYDYQSVDYDESEGWDYEIAGLQLGHWLNSGFRIFAEYGRESDFDEPFKSGLDDDFWEAGFSWEPTTRTSFEAAYGQRSYGDSIRAIVSHESAKLQTELSYTEEPISTARSNYNIRPLDQQDNLGEFLGRPGAAEVYLAKIAEWVTNYDLIKSNLYLRVFKEQHTDRVSLEGETLGNEDTWGAALGWEWRAGTRTTLGVDLDFAHRDFGDTSRSDDYGRVAVEATYSLGSRTSVTGSYWYSRQDSDAGSEEEYVENLFRLYVTIAF